MYGKQQHWLVVMLCMQDGEYAMHLSMPCRKRKNFDFDGLSPSGNEMEKVIQAVNITGTKDGLVKV